MNRNKAVASTAITKAVSGATTGTYNKSNLKACSSLAKHWFWPKTQNLGGGFLLYVFALFHNDMRVWPFSWLSCQQPAVFGDRMRLKFSLGVRWCRKCENGNGNPPRCYCHYKAVKSVSRRTLPGTCHLTQRLPGLHQREQHFQVCREHKNNPSYLYSAMCNLLMK